MSTAHDRPFAPEPTPVLADDAEAPSAPEPSTPANQWVGEKTILIADDAQASAYLQIIATGEWLAIDEFPAVLGRHDLATVTLSDGSVSRRHAQIVREGESFAIEDLESSNGIRVEGKRVGRMMLMDGDRFELGRIGLKFSTREPGTDAVVLATTQVASSGGQARASKAMPDFSAAAGGFDLKKVLPLIVAAAAVLLALLMFMNRGPRTVLLPDSEVVDTAPAPATAEPPVQTAQPSEATATAPDPAVASDTSAVVADGESSDAAGDAAVAGTETVNSAGDPDPAITTGAGDSTTATAEASNPQVSEPAPAEASTPETAAETATTAPAPKVAAAEPVAPAPAPAAPRRPPQRSADFSRAYIDKSLEMYMNGDSDNAIRRLGVLSRSQRNQRRFRDEALRLQQQTVALVENYEQGQSALDRGDRAEAAASWARFLRDEGQLFGGRKSVYANRISQVVADQYTRDGDAANAEGRFHDAHLAWSKALQYAPDGPARDSLARLESRAQELYREGYRLERVNIERAKALWREVINLLPPGTEYHTKARAKLRWHEKVVR